MSAPKVEQGGAYSRAMSHPRRFRGSALAGCKAAPTVEHRCNDKGYSVRAAHIVDLRQVAQVATARSVWRRGQWATGLQAADPRVQRKIFPPHVVVPVDCDALTYAELLGGQLGKRIEQRQQKSLILSVVEPRKGANGGGVKDKLFVFRVPCTYEI
jgi:hypothetical protein